MAKRRAELSLEAQDALTKLLKALRSTAEAGTAWDALRERCNELHRREGTQAKLAFEVGDRVEFETKRWPFKIQGRVVSIGDTNIKVKADGKDGLTWRVFAGLLRKVEPKKETAAAG